ncbi:Transcription factor PERIANTHIA [Sesamum angolense]|uniref:Transcription factor PERIANTHIA n=1 Tax=Sesamum angolense TaxID=2727404 RepID=A0AAE1XF94_9LAMI|nr:Transcription factor PERIANTHIA [Sesamum angolense]
MHSFKAALPQGIALTNSDVYCHSHSPFYLRGEEGGRNGPRFTDLGELEQSAGHAFHHDDAVNLSRSSIYNDMKASNVSVVSSNLQFGGLNNSLGSAEMVSSGTGVDSGHFMLPKGTMVGVGAGGGGGGGGGALGNGHFENWGDSGVVADHSQQTDTSTDTDDKNQYPGVHDERLIVVDSMDQSKSKIGDQKALRRLAQNREAAKKSRMRKKAYVQQLENSRLRLTQLEQELKRARQQGVFVTSGFSADQSHSVGGTGALAFDIDYARWLDEHQRLINDLRLAVNSHMYFTCFLACGRLLLKGVSCGWEDSCSEVLKILGNQIEPLTEQQLVGICNLRQSSQQAEDALSQGMEALQQSLVETLSSSSLGPRNSGNVADYMGQMAIAMSKLATLENFVHQADLLRQQTLRQLQRILTTRQAARALLAIGDYKSRLRALSSLWLARPKE